MAVTKAASSSHHDQAPCEVVMVRPANFGYDPDTAETNAFQQVPSENEEQLRKKARVEFDGAVSTLRSHGVSVKVFEDRASPVCPDAIFPNNWFSTHADGTVVVYPMHAPARRNEKRMDIVDYFKDNFKVDKVIDLSGESEKNSLFLEGTGSIVFDFVNAAAFACVSPRTNGDLFKKVCNDLGYKAVLFTSADAAGSLIYHTNVMMWVGNRAAGVCLDSIKDQKERELVLCSLTHAGRTLIELSHEEVTAFAGNCLEVRSADGNKHFLVMSERARDGLTGPNMDKVKAAFDDVIVCEVPFIEYVSGGGIRCMMAGNHLQKK